jgi:hypothetical protein
MESEKENEQATVSGLDDPPCHAPILGATYLWDYGGTGKEEITVQEIRHETIPVNTHDDGSYSPETTRTKVRIGDCSWIGWYRGGQFEFLQNDERSDRHE